MEKCSLYDHLKSILNSNDCEAQIGEVQYTFTKNIFAWKKNNGIWSSEDSNVIEKRKS